MDKKHIALGGRTAEEIVLGDVSTGAQNDLQGATDLVRHMVAQYGMKREDRPDDLRRRRTDGPPSGPTPAVQA